ncbi:hypothetical protein K435DRAFT_804014 [Dendrothele bispora CBS 962.96]|uniref:Uncharacterized protein n=1 Tax=Dendrothele bispora (strain CBS 962.96) TaxID=1314807 RepID=A0A4S8LFK2_DENBC|nr:hypothetical protein K435DRAFT_804014 [Dendrothele bispora CBS 962.96]
MKRDPVKFRPREGFLSLDDDEDGSSEDELKVKAPKGLQGMKRPLYLKQCTSMASTNTTISFSAGQQQRLKGTNDGVDLDNLGLITRYGRLGGWKREKYRTIRVARVFWDSNNIDAAEYRDEEERRGMGMDTWAPEDASLMLWVFHDPLAWEIST